MLYYKKVDAVQFNLTDEQKANIAQHKPVYFEGSKVKHIGGEQYIVLLQQGENLIKVVNTQWLVRHPDGLWQLFWPDKFAALFRKGEPEDFATTAYDPFKAKALNQPNTHI